MIAAPPWYRLSFPRLNRNTYVSNEAGEDRMRPWPSAFRDPRTLFLHPPPAPERRSAVADQTEHRASAEAKHEEWKGKGVALRAFFYIFGTHVFAGFIWLLFYLGEHAEK